ncbi:hypothetical protein D3C77_642210 [compost metagenome]
MMLFRIGSVQHSTMGVNAEVISTTPLLSAGQLLFEGAIMVLMLVLIDYLLSKKVEI